MGKRKPRRFKLSDDFDGEYWTVMTPTRRATRYDLAVLRENTAPSARVWKCVGCVVIC